MGRRGPPPTPTSLRLLKGNPSKRPIPQNEPKVEPAIPECPAHLDGEARREWERITKELAPVGILSKLDRAALALYCQAWADWLFYSGKIRESASVVRSPSGYPVINPYVSLADQAFERVRKLLRILGLSPGDRASLRIEAAQRGEPDPFEVFLNNLPRRE